MNRSILLSLSLFLLFGCGPKGSFAEQQLADAAKQYKTLMKMPDRKRGIPYSFDEESGKVLMNPPDGWTGGFYPGTLFHLYTQTKDTAFYHEGTRMLKQLDYQQYNEYIHDQGIMMFNSFAKADSIRPSHDHKKVLINAALTLKSKFSPEVGCIRTWFSQNPSEFIVDLDVMMNLELLFWASKMTKDKQFYDVAVTHANTTMRNHFREDHSSYHLVVYDPITGMKTGTKTFYGFSDDSQWARGQAYGLYGFTVAYRETGDSSYLAQANRIAEFILNHPNLPEDLVPYYDFNNTDLAYRDASAAAVIASALLELQRFADSERSNRYLEAARKILQTLSSDPYKAPPGTNGGFVLKHSVGNLLENTDVDVPTSYADYYYIEALIRLKNINKQAN